MKKTILLSVGIATTLALAAATVKHFVPQTPPSAPATTELTGLTFYATINQSLEWTDNGQANMKYAVYRIDPASDDAYFTRVSAIESAKAADAGVYYDGYYYTVKVPTSSSYSNYSSTFTRYEVDTWTPEQIAWFGNGNGNVAEDMTVDYTTGTVYAIGMNTYNGPKRQLKTVNIATGEMTPVAEVAPRVYAIAADAEGQIWGVGTPEGLTAPTNLYKVDKTTGEATLVTELDINLYTGSLSSLTFDLRDGKLYYTAQTYVENADKERTWTNGLFEINTSTGHATLLREYEYREILAGLTMLDSHPKAPKAAEGLEFVFNEGSTTEGKASCTLPTAAYDGTALQGTIDVKVTVDGKKVAEATGLTPGDKYLSDAISLTDSKTQRVKVYCYSGSLKSLPAFIDVYAGTDLPGKPADVKAEVNADGDMVKISWQAAEGANGGYIDTENLRYDLTLMPDNQVIATDLTACEYEHRFVDRNMGVSQIRVTARIGDVSGSPAVSPIFIAGTPWPVPYLEAFNYASEIMWPFTLIDANNDRGDYGFYWLYDYNRRAAWYYSSPTVQNYGADDWLITPAIAFEQGKVYRLQFDTYGYMGGVNTLEVSLGRYPEVASLTHKVLRHQYDTHGYSAAQPLNLETVFIPEANDLRIGIHNVSDNSDHMFIDNIYVSVYGPTTIPAASENLAANKVTTGVRVSFNAPTTTAAGEKLTSLKDIRIYRDNSDGELLTTIEDPEPGAALSFTDPNTASGVKTYAIIASNESGAGVPASVTVNTYADVPRAVENLTVTPRNGWTQAMVTWNYPASMTGVNNQPLTPDEISYDVFRVINYNSQLIAQDLKATEFFDSECARSIPETSRQINVTYKVVPHTNGGEGAAKTSDPVMMGASYALPFNESWKMQRPQNPTWSNVNSSNGGGWYVNSDVAYDPRAICQDSDYGQVSFNPSRYGVSSCDYMSPRIDMSNYINPKVSFWLFRSVSGETQNSVLRIGFVSEEHEREILSTEYRVYNSADGWEQYTVEVPEKFAKSSRVSVILYGFGSSYKGQIHVDNLSITGEQPENEIKVNRIVGGERALIGSDNSYDVEIANIGSKDMTGVDVELYADDALIGTYNFETVAAGATVMAPFTYSPGLDNHERNIQLKGVIKCEADGSTANNEIEATVSLVAPMLPYVTDLRGYSPDSRSVNLDWQEPVKYPHAEQVTDDVDSYEPFAITGIGGWTTRDADKQVTVQISLGNGTLQWDHAGEPQAFIVFNPSQCNATSVIKPRSGNQCFVSFAALNENDDWLISPQLSGEAQTLTFYTKCLHPSDLNERFEVWTSQGSPEISDFACISGTTPIAVTSYDEWSRQSFELPEGTKFFAIRCVSKQQTGLMIDDITYSPVHPGVELWGFNVYRDGKRINDTEVGDFTYTDTNVTAGQTYSYAVSSVFDSGESIHSLPVSVTVGYAGIDGAAADASDIDIHAVPGGISVAAPEKTRVAVYTVDGRMLYYYTSAGTRFLPTAPGIYLVNAGGHTAKVVVR